MPRQEEIGLAEFFDCNKCGQCCYFFEMIVNPQHLRISGIDINKAFKNQLGVEFKDIHQCSIRINAQCLHLDTKTGLCLTHNNRPNICKNHFCQRYPKIDNAEVAE